MSIVVSQVLNKFLDHVVSVVVVREVRRVVSESQVWPPDGGRDYSSK